MQYDSIGTAFGYCVRHNVVLKQADHTTCGQHLRKDLLVPERDDENQRHRSVFDPKRVVALGSNGDRSTVDEWIDREAEVLQTDQVGSVVADYGQLQSKVESLAQLRQVPGARAELAMLSLSRAYVKNCVTGPGRRSGTWKSGIHLFWWTRNRLTGEPQYEARDLRYVSNTTVDRQMDLARWALLMLRLTFLADVAWYAKGDPLHRLTSLPEEAAAATPVNTTGLLKWLKSEAMKRIERVMPVTRYRKIALEIHRER